MIHFAWVVGWLFVARKIRNTRAESVPLRAIRFGMAAIKGVGEIAVDAIIRGRTEHGKFNTLSELCERVDGRTVNRKTLEALIKTGACDTFGQTRATLFAQIDRTLRARRQHSIRQAKRPKLAVWRVGGEGAAHARGHQQPARVAAA